MSEQQFDKIAVRCQFCGKLFLTVRTIFKDDGRATCAACWREALDNTERMKIEGTR